MNVFVGYVCKLTSNIHFKILSMSGFVAVHCGAGYHKSTLKPKYKRTCRRACIAAGNILNAGGSALDACRVAVMSLEKDPMTNAGFGSNLTLTGDIECDASIMDGETLNFGACGAVQGIKYPISLASEICKNQSVVRPCGLIAPSLLVGPGAYEYAKENNVTLIDNKKLVTKKSYRKHKKYKQILNHIMQNKSPVANSQFTSESTSPELKKQKLDTVGAVCIDSRGHVAAGSSSGGIFLKYNGRIGQAAVYGCGAWADSFSNKTENSVAVTTSGTGEYLVKTVLAKELARQVKNSACPVTAFQKSFKEEFLESRYLQTVPTERLGGALVLHVTPSGHGDLIWGHSTRSMIFGYMDSTNMNAKTIVSELPDKSEGRNLVVSGINFKLNHS